MTPRETALDLFRRGFSCSQAVFAALAGGRLDRDSALRIAQPFGGGIARRGGLCGAASGALMAIGLVHGRVRAEDDEARETTYRLTREFLDRFAARFGTLDCRGLLGHDIGTPEGAAAIKERDLHRTVCEGLVAGAVEIAEEVLAAER